MGVTPSSDGGVSGAGACGRGGKVTGDRPSSRVERRRHGRHGIQRRAHTHARTFGPERGVLLQRRHTHPRRRQDGRRLLLPDQLGRGGRERVGALELGRRDAERRRQVLHMRVRVCEAWKRMDEWVRSMWVGHTQKATNNTSTPPHVHDPPADVRPHDQRELPPVPPVGAM